ncbi:hypothetical protein PIROE2DRAFT_67750 [Piromyces sp. E2]|nr:hypothetical protein PIROE2DRAFT_67750 [Piromyces sp. E2]|eukprot:OUM58480.1 hypothetical protein PIROE2DRAFT_67750 [Piromyces sp. E2]
MKFYNFLLCVVLLCTLQWSVSARTIRKSLKIRRPKKHDEISLALPEKINEDSELYIADVKSKHRRFKLEKCRYLPKNNVITCEYEKVLNKYKYRLDISILDKPECEINKETEIVSAKLWAMVKDTNVYKPNNEIKTQGKTKVLTDELYRSQQFQLYTNQDDCVINADFDTAKITRI